MILASFSDITYQLLDGFLVTFEIFFYSLVFSLPLGLVVTFGSMSRFKPLKVLVRGFIWIIRGTPLMLQVIVVFYGPGLWFNYPIKSRYFHTRPYLIFLRTGKLQLHSQVSSFTHYACRRFIQICSG